MNNLTTKTALNVVANLGNKELECIAKVVNRSLNVEAFTAFVEVNEIDIKQEDANKLIDNFESKFTGAYESKRAYIEEQLSESYLIDASLKQFFNYEAYTDYVFEDLTFYKGFIFYK